MPALGDALAATFGHDVNRPGLNAFVDQSQARNGLVSQQTQNAWLEAQQKQMQMQAASGVEDSVHQLTGDPNIAALAGNYARMNPEKGALTKEAIDGILALKMANPAHLNDAEGTAAQFAYQGKRPEPVAVPNTFTTAPGMDAPNIQMTPMGQAQLAQTKAVTGEDWARAEAAHAAAAAKTNPNTSPPLTPEALNAAVQVVMANPDRIRDYASYGTSGQPTRQQIQNEVGKRLTDAGMTPSDLIIQRALAKASIGGAGAAAKQGQVMDAFMPLVENNGQRILDLLDQVDPQHTGNVPIVEGYSRALGRNLGSDDLAELHSVFGTYQNEVGRLLSGSPTMTGVISDKARGDVQAMAPENMTSGQAARVINRIHTELSVRRNAIADSLRKEAEQQLPVTGLSGVGGTPTAPLATSAPVVNPGPPQGGQLPTGWKVSVQ